MAAPASEAAADRGRVQRHVRELADARRQEPLERLVADAGDARRQRRRDDRRRVGPVAPHAQEQPGDEAELHEVDALDGADRGVGAAGGGGVGPGRGDRHDERAVADEPIGADARDREADRDHDRQREPAFDEAAEPRGERRAESGSRAADAGSGEDERDRGGDREAEGQVRAGAAHGQRTTGSVDASPWLRHFMMELLAAREAGMSERSAGRPIMPDRSRRLRDRGSSAPAR